MGMEGCTEGHGVAQRGAQRGTEGCTEGCRGARRRMCEAAQRGV